MPATLSPFFLNLELDPLHVGAWTVPLIGLVAAGLTFAVGFAVAGRRRARQPVSRSARPAAPTAPADPFVQGSQSERRAAVRREGTMVPIVLADADGGGEPVPGWVVDRSVGGLCLRLNTSVLPGTRVSVRPRDASTMMPWTQVEVKSCRQQDGAWEVGCQFVRTPPWSVLLMFG
jgi:hypothetical protein